MKVVESLAELRQARARLLEPVGLVPTMGFLHDGHLSLVTRARQECRSVAASIFINPTQFGPTEDLAAYPRDLPRDLASLEAAGVDLVWTPSPEAMYPPGFQTWVTVEGVSQGLEGERRPGHFRGVATVVTKLFHAFGAQRAYFGQKDAQQVAVVKKMAADLNMDLEVVACPTVRETNGLAMSSRNTHLTGDQRRAATVLYRALTRAQEMWAGGEKDAGEIRHEMTELIGKESLADIVYVSIAHAETLKEIHRVKPPALVSLAVKFGKTRLIDNVVLE